MRKGARGSWPRASRMKREASLTLAERVLAGRDVSCLPGAYVPTYGVNPPGGVGLAGFVAVTGFWPESLSGGQAAFGPVRGYYRHVDKCVVAPSWNVPVLVPALAEATVENLT